MNIQNAVVVGILAMVLIGLGGFAVYIGMNPFDINAMFAPMWEYQIVMTINVELKAE